MIFRKVGKTTTKNFGIALAFVIKTSGFTRSGSPRFITSHAFRHFLRIEPTGPHKHYNLCFRSREVKVFLRLIAMSSVLMQSGVTFSHAGIVTFGTGANQFQMEFVTIGNPGNAPDTTGTLNPAGSVGYTYRIGKFEVSENMINKFNASQSLQITKDTRGANKPATSVSLNEAARFVNWLNTSTGYAAAYKFTNNGVNDSISWWIAGDTGYAPLNPFRNSFAKYVLPSHNEWYKAAYYNPSDSIYYNFPNGSDNAPTAVASGTASNTAVYGQSFGQGPADVNQAGGLSPYGVMGLGGNVSEWEEFPTFRAVRGGDWFNNSSLLSSSNRNGIGFTASDQYSFIGFRVVSLRYSPSEVPEPGTMVIGTLFGLGGLLAKRRMKR
jgi:sulfatase modifying factor 1